MNTERSLAERARVHAALGDPARLAVVDRLQLSDHSPGELAGALDLPTNLVAHHLHTLQAAGVVERVRSEGDRRRTYVRLVPGALQGLMVAPTRVAPRVVFVCTHNSARSQLAAATWATRSRVAVASAGTQPAARVHPLAVAAARRHGLDLVGRGTQHVDDTVRADDLVVAVCDNAHERLHGTGHVHWSVPDPVRVGTDAAFEHALEVIEDRVGRLVAAVTPEEERPA
jgi:ArsR family transcriptional regulator, arsenate/arsenite/antimonite-responsive transcriptional repressor / arsenate reductase (thioredoxin)